MVVMKSALILHQTIIIIMIYPILLIHSAPVNLSDLRSPEITINAIKDLIMRGAEIPQEQGGVKSVIAQTSSPSELSTTTTLRITSTDAPTITEKLQETTTQSNGGNGKTTTESSKSSPQISMNGQSDGKGKTTTDSSTEVSVNKQSDGKVEVKVENQINIDTKRDENPDKNMPIKPSKQENLEQMLQKLKLVQGEICELTGLGCGNSLPW